MKRILQTGTYNSANRGDAAMQLSFYHAMKARRDDCDILISTPFPNIDKNFYGKGIRLIRSRRRNLPYAFFQLLAAYLALRSFEMIGNGIRKLFWDEEIEATERSDLIVDLSGDMLTDDYGPHVAISHYFPIFLGLALRKRIFVCAQSIGPFSKTRWIARFLLASVEKVTVRDEISREHLRQLGIDIEKVSVTADLAFLLKPGSPQRARALLDEEGLRTNSKKILGVSLSTLVERMYIKQSGAASRDFISLMAGVLDHCAEAFNVQIMFVSHVLGPASGKDDRNICRRVAQRMKKPSIVLNGEHRPDDIKGIIACCSMFLGARMHANIAALSSGVPVLALSYSHKTQGIMDMLGQSDMVLRGADLEKSKLIESLATLWAQRDKRCDDLRTRLPELHRLANDNIEIACALISRDCP